MRVPQAAPQRIHDRTPPASVREHPHFRQRYIILYLILRSTPAPRARVKPLVQACPCFIKGPLCDTTKTPDPVRAGSSVSSDVNLSGTVARASLSQAWYESTMKQKGPAFCIIAMALVSVRTVCAGKDDDLIAAARAGNVAAVQALLAKGAKLNAVNRRGDSPLSEASQKGNLEVTQLLLAKGASVNLGSPPLSFTPLSKAAMNGHLDVVRFLVGSCADVSARGRVTGTALETASCHGQTEVVIFLLDKEADVRNAEPLWCAAFNGYAQVALALIAHGADINAQRKGHLVDTPLLAAAQFKHADVVELLLTRGADVNAASSPSGRTALMFAAQHGDAGQVSALLAKGADAKMKDGTGRTALIFACQYLSVPVGGGAGVDDVVES